MASPSYYQQNTEEGENMNVRSTRGTGFTKDEDVTLCQSFMAVSQDPIIGNDQKSQRFWDRIRENYQVDFPVIQRNNKSLQKRISTIQKQVRRLSNCIRQVENMQISGANESDVVSK